MKSIVATVVLSGVFMASQAEIPAALQSMADTERAFAEACTRKGIRDSFLEYFADCRWHARFIRHTATVAVFSR